MRRAFEDGTILSVPNSVRIGQLELKAGAQVTAAYEEQRRQEGRDHAKGVSVQPRRLVGDGRSSRALT